MNTDPESTDLPDAFDIAWEAIAKRLGTVRTAIPARVTAYSPTGTTGPTVSAQIAVRDVRVDPETGETEQIRPPVVHGVPVAFPGGSGGMLTWHLAAGDPVLLLFADRSIDEWKTSGQADNSPADLLRRFDLNDAIALPIGPARGAIMSPTAYASGATVLAATDVRLGASTATDFVALSTPLRTELNAIWAMIATVAAAIPSGLAPPVTPAISNNAATRVKAL